MSELITDKPRLMVVAAIIRDDIGRFLLAQRPAHRHQGGCWEFPGGKVEAGETLERALGRELKEELGVTVIRSRPFMTIDHAYPDLNVRLCFREVLAWVGQIHGHEGQAWQWADLDAMKQLTFPAANRPVVSALGLPDKMLVLPEQLPEKPTHWLAQQVAAGASLVYLRGIASADIAQPLVDAVHEQGGKVLIADDAALATKVGGEGVHLTHRGKRSYLSLPPGMLLSVACHNALELDQAARWDADLVTLSPVHSTPTHSDVTPLGWQRFEAIASGRPFAVYALGGVLPGDLDIARASGARGVAGIRAFL